MTVAVYMYLMFLVKHPGKPMANFEHIYPVLTGDNLIISILTGITLAGILYFAFRHFKTLFWILKQFQIFKSQPGYLEFKKSRAGLSLMTVPLTLAMTVNVSFILGGAFIPNLWSFVEYLFPFALLAFGVIGYNAFKIFIEHISEYIHKGGLNSETSHTFWIIIPILTILGITIVRLSSSIAHNVLHIDMPTGFLYIILCLFVSIQAAFGIIGYKIMKSNGYFDKYVSGKDHNPASYGLICPGVASFVLGMFLIGWGFIENDIVTKYSLVHYSLIAFLALIQIKTIGTIRKLDNKYF